MGLTFFTSVLMDTQALPQPLAWEVVFGLIAATAAALTLLFYAYYRHWKVRLSSALQEIKILQKIVNTAEEASSWWVPQAEHINCSSVFLSLFDLKPDHPITFADVFNQLTSDEATLLSQALQKLTYQKLPFEGLFHPLHLDYPVILRGHFSNLENTGFAVLLAQPMLGPSVDEQLTIIREERDRLRLILDMIPIAVWYRDSNAHVIFCNAVYAGIVEATPQEVSETHSEWVPPERHNSPYHLAIKARTTKLKQVQQTHIVIEGGRRLIEMAELPLDDREASIGYAIDMTEIETTQADLSKHISAYQEILHMLSTPVAVYGPDTRLHFFNQAYHKMFGFEEAWLYSKPTLGEILEELREHRKLPEQQNFPAYKKECLDLFHNLLQPQETLLHQPDGQVLRVLVAPYPLGGLFYVFDDVTDKLTLEQRFNTLMAVQKETIDHLHEGIIVLGSDYRLRLTNRAMENMWGLEGLSHQYPEPHVNELLKQSESYFKEEFDGRAVQEMLLNILNRRTPYKARFVRVDEKVIAFSYVPLPDGSHLFNFVDISDTTRFEQALEERNEALEQAARLKSEFISNVSYELRAPLNTITGFTEMLLNQYFGPLNERQLDYCTNILDSSQRLLTLINDMIDLANLGAGQLTLSQHPIYLPAFLSSTLSLIFHRANDQGLEVISEILTPIETFIGDERRLKQALFNLLMNAVKYTPTGGRIRLIAATTPDQQWLQLKVQDTGIGIKPEEQVVLLQDFQGSHNKKGRGVGLGIPLVKSLIELHGGMLHIQSQPEQGTTIICEIPLLAPLPLEGTRSHDNKSIH